MNKPTRVLILIILMQLNFFVFATNLKLPENHSVNGGLAIIPVDIKQKPEVYYKGIPIAAIPSFTKNQWLIIVGIPLDETSPIQNLDVKSPTKGVVPFHVSEKYYRTQRLNIKNQRKVDPYAKDRERIERETTEQKEIFSQFTKRNPYTEGFKSPLHGPVSSLFGLKRVYNNKPRAPHSGLDIAAPKGTEVHAINGGTVVSAKEYFFTGNTVIIDHGLGLFSLYAHLDSYDVKKGDSVKQGQLIGKVGATGRVTGPHLHWGMILNETLVDPLLFVNRRIITEKS